MQAGFDIRAQVNGALSASGSRKIAAADGSSSFVEVLGNAALDGGVWSSQGIAIAGGLINGATGLISGEFPGPGIIVTSRTGVGRYNINYAIAGPFVSTPVVIPIGYHGHVELTGTWNTQEANIQGRNATTLAAQDLTVAFIIIGALV
jgi:hypothetical protein